MPAISHYRRRENRCEARLIEYGKASAEFKRRSWRCDQMDGHKGIHLSNSGHRRWEGDGDTYNVQGDAEELAWALRSAITLPNRRWKDMLPYWEALCRKLGF